MKPERPVTLGGILGAGFLIWLFPFAMGMAIFPLQERLPQLFDGIMVLCLVAATLFLGARFAVSPREKPVRGAALGAVWMIVCLAVDLPFFLLGPPQMELTWYLQDIGIGYLLIPMVTMVLDDCSRGSKDNHEPLAGRRNQG